MRLALTFIIVAVSIGIKDGFNGSLIILLVLGFLLLPIAYIFNNFLDRENEQRDKNEQKIKKLEQNLDENIRESDEIITEIQSRKEELRTINKELIKYQKLQKINTQTIRTIQDILSAQLASESRKSLFRDVVMTIFGAIFGLLLSRIF